MKRTLLFGIALVGVFFYFAPTTTPTSKGRARHHARAVSTESSPSRAPAQTAAPTEKTVTSAAPIDSTLPPPVRPRALDPDQHFEELRNRATTVEANLNGRAHHALKARAYPDADYRADLGPALFKQNGFIIVADRGSELIVKANSRPVLLEGSRVGIVSGTLVLKLRDVNDAARVAARHAMQLIYTDQTISRAFVRVPDGFNVASDAARIVADPDILDVHVEILHGQVRAQ